MLALGLCYAVLSGIANGLFSFPMKVIPSWKWENIWGVFIVVACLVMPLAMTLGVVDDLPAIVRLLPPGAVAAALGFGFAWGFGAILFGLSVDRLGVSLANSLVIGLSSALGSIAPLLIKGTLRFDDKQLLLVAGVGAFLLGVALCAGAGRLREGPRNANPSVAGYFFALGSGAMSAVFNIGYSLALPIADAGQRAGLSSFTSTNIIWMFMLGAGSIPNLVFCGYLMRRNRSLALLAAPQPWKTWGLSIAMGLLWGGSIFLYGAATPLLGDIGPSIGWPLSLAVGLLVANVMGWMLGEWRGAEQRSLRLMRLGIAVLLVAIMLCALSAR